MAAATAAAASAYPPPPPYYKLYSSFGDDPASAPPPPPPMVGTYSMFGGNYTTNDVLPGLEEEGLRQLYPKGPDVDYKKELRALNKEFLLQFLELTDALIDRPSQSARCVEDMTLILRNIHHLLNSLRPHQARATLTYLLEAQIQRRKQAVAEIHRRREEARALLLESLSLTEAVETMSSDSKMPMTVAAQFSSQRSYSQQSLGYGPSQAFR